MPTPARMPSQRPPAAIEKVVMARPRRRVVGQRAMIEKVMSLRRLQGRHEGLLRKRAPRMLAAMAVVGLVLLVFAMDAPQLLDRGGMQVDAQVDVGIGVARIDQQRRGALRLVDL